MRVDYAGKVGISNTGVELKGSDTVGNREKSVKRNALIKDTPYSVTAMTVEKALFSLESELAKIKEDAGKLDVKLIKKQMAILSNTLSGEEYQKLQEEGYSLNDTDVETIVTVVDKIKLELAKGGMDIGIFGDDLSMDQLESMTGSVSQARQMAADLTECKDSDITYLAENELEPTIENLYRAQHSGSRQRQAAERELPEDENLRRQIGQAIEAAGLPVNGETLGYGALLLGHDIPLTPENIAYVDKLKQLKLPPEQTQVEKAMATAVAQGREPAEAYLMEGYSWKDRAVNAQEVIGRTGEEALEKLVKEGQPLTIEQLARAQHQIEASSSQGSADSGGEASVSIEPVVSEPEELRLVTARRQLEETRLAMTVQANHHLLKRGITIETMELEQLVKELKEIEDNYYKTLLEQQGIEATGTSVGIFRETMEKTEALKFLPAYALGGYPLERTSLEVLYEVGTGLAEDFGRQEQAGRTTQAAKAYDTMMTVPRADLGDSLKKAFGNMDDILEEQGLETSQANRRAVRILAYNQMEINEASVSRIKMADQKMQNLFQHMKPSVVMELIREGVHPLRMDVVTLNKKAEEIAAQQDPGQEEKYSKYLWQLEQKHEITPEEKESYIGIYRLLRQIEKTDGAVIGAVVNQGGELSLKNLLSAVRTRRTHGIDVTMDQEFGGTSQVTRTEASISQQIDTAFSAEAVYQADCAKEAFERLTVEELDKCMEDSSWQELTPEQLLWRMKEQQAADESQEWERQQEEGYYQQQKELLQTGRNAEEAVFSLLSEYGFPVDTWHIMAAGQMMNNRNTIFRQLFDADTVRQEPELAKAKEVLLERFAEAVKTPEDMAEAQKALADTAEHVMDTMRNDPEVTNLDVRDLKLLRTQIQMAGRMSREENYAVPVMIADEMTNVQLKIVRGREKRGMADILFETERLGKVAARIQVTAHKVEGFVISDRTDTIALLKSREQELENQMRTEENQRVRFDFVSQENISLSEFASGRSTGEERKKDTEEYQVQTRQLYNIARAFLETVKQAVQE